MELRDPSISTRELGQLDRYWDYKSFFFLHILGFLDQALLVVTIFLKVSRINVSTIFSILADLSE